MVVAAAETLGCFDFWRPFAALRVADKGCSPEGANVWLLLGRSRTDAVVRPSGAVGTPVVYWCEPSPPGAWQTRREVERVGREVSAGISCALALSQAGPGRSSNASVWAGRTIRKSRSSSVAMTVRFRRSAAAMVDASMMSRLASA